MNEMIEQVARALALEDSGVEQIESMDDPDYYRKLARIAIKAMREPTKEMIVVGGDKIDDCLDSNYDSNADGESYHYNTMKPGSQTDVYQAMIDAALKEPT